MVRGVYRRPAAIRRRRFVPHGFTPAATAGHVVVRRRVPQRRRRPFLLRRRPLVRAQTFAPTQAPILRRMAAVRRPGARRARRAVIQVIRAQTVAAPVLRPRLRIRPARPPRARRVAPPIGTPAVVATQAPLPVRIRRVSTRRPSGVRRPRPTTPQSVAQATTGAVPARARRPSSVRHPAVRRPRAILPTQPAAPVAPGFSQVLRTIQRQRRKMKERQLPKPAILRLLDELPPALGVDRVEQSPKLRTFRPGLYRGLVHGEGVRG